MKTKSILMAALLMMAGGQAFAQTETETVVYTYGVTPADGVVVEGTDVSFTLGNDGGWKAPAAIKAGTSNADFKQTYTNADGKEKTEILYVTGSSNPTTKTTADDGTTKSSSYSPANKNLPNTGTYYTISPKKAGTVRACVVLNANKSLYVVKSDGTMLDPANGEFTITDGNGDAIELVTYTDGNGKETPYTLAAKVNGGMVKFDVEAGEQYYIFCTGSKLGFAGVEFTPKADETPASDKLGDINGDGLVNVADVVALINIVLGLDK